MSKRTTLLEEEGRPPAARILAMSSGPAAELLPVTQMSSPGDAGLCDVISAARISCRRGGIPPCSPPTGCPAVEILSSGVPAAVAGHQGSMHPVACSRIRSLPRRTVKLKNTKKGCLYVLYAYCQQSYRHRSAWFWC